MTTVWPIVYWTLVIGGGAYLLWDLDNLAKIYEEEIAQNRRSQ
jgi:hypothetical protein